MPFCMCCCVVGFHLRFLSAVLYCTKINDDDDDDDDDGGGGGSGYPPKPDMPPKTIHGKESPHR